MVEIERERAFTAGDFVERNQFWIFLAIGLLTGACLQMIKSPTPSPIRLAGFANFETLLEEGKEVRIVEEIKPSVSRRAFARAEAVPAPIEVAANDITPSEITPGASPTESGDKPTTKPTAPLTEAEKKKKAEEDKKKKDLEAKKKLDEQHKKEKEDNDLKERQALEAKNNAQPTATPSPDTKPDDADPSAVPSEGASAPLTPAAASNGIPQTAVEWEAYLLKDVDYQKMSLFVRLYQTGQVSATVYYTVINVMLEDSRPLMRDLAVSGLSSTPSPTSFTTLMAARNDSDPTVRKNVSVAIQQYSQIENLRFLTSILVNQGDSTTVLEAIQLIKASADSNLHAFSSPTTTTTSTGNTSTGTANTLSTNSPQAATISRYYSPFVVTLQSVATQSRDNNVRAAAAQAKTDLQTLLSPLS